MAQPEPVIKCELCGHNIKLAEVVTIQNKQFCPACAIHVTEDLQVAPKEKLPLSGLGITALVLGIVGLVFFWVPVFGLVLSILAVIFGGVGLYQAINKITSGLGFSIAGIALGVAGILLSALFLAGLAQLGV